MLLLLTMCQYFSKVRAMKRQNIYWIFEKARNRRQNTKVKKAEKLTEN